MLDGLTRLPVVLDRPCDFNLGDIVLCPAVIAIDAAELKVCSDHHTIVVLTHGLCHLSGFTHGTVDDANAMRSEEQRLLRMYEQIEGLAPHTLLPLTTFS
jgi:probable rRNA maturation factor